MAIKVKEVIMYISKGLVFSIKTSYRTACGHPLIFGVVFLLLILYRMFPSIFAFLVTSSPVIVCTAVLLGTLLSYGAPNTPKNEEENRKTEKISSLQVGSAVGGLVTKKDESFTVETQAKTSTEVDERTVKEAAPVQASNSACNEVAREVPSTAMHDAGNHKDDTLLPASSADEDMKETNSDKRLPEEREVCDHGIFVNEEFPVEQQSDGALRLGEDVGDVSLRVQISTPELDNLYDSSLGSPRQPIDSQDTSSGSDSNSSGSSSPDASLADIIPMLDELHPLSDSEHPQATMRSTGYSDSASSGSSSDDESNGWNAEEKVESKEDRGKEAVQEEKHGGDEDAVAWNADDQNNVMDLGISEVERNRRLESLIAKRRARKLMRIQTEKNLLDINSYYTPIPSISVPRRNPFDFSYDSVPGSAPPTLQPRENPFDLPYDQVGKNSSFLREFMGHHDFVSPPEREMFSGTRENYSFGPSFSVGLHEEEDGSKLKSYYATERMGSQQTEFIAFQRQSSEESDFNLSFVSESNKVSSVTGLEDHTEVLPQPQVHQESNLLHLANFDAEHVEQDSNSVTELDSVNVRNEEIKEDVGDDPANNLNTSIVVEETCQPTDSSSAMEEEIGEAAAANLPLSDAEKLDVIEARYESDSSTSEEDGKSSGMDIHKESANLEKTRNDILQSDRDIDMPVAHPVYDSYPSSAANSLSNTSLLDEVLLYEGKENFISSFLLSDVQADFSEVEPTSETLQLDSSFEDRDYVEVNESVGDELAYDIGGPSKASSSASSLDEIESSSTEITETKEHDAIRVEVSETTEDVPELAAGEIMPISSFSSIDSEAGEVSIVHVDKGTQPEGDRVMDVPPSKEESVIDPSCEAGVEESQVGILDLPSVPEENVADLKYEEHENTTESAVICGITGLQVTEDPDLHLYDAKEQSSSDPKATGSISNDDHANELVPVEEGIDALAASSIIPPHDGGATGVPILGSTKSMGFSTLSKTTSELEMESNDDSSHSEGNITAVQNEGSYLENPNNLNEGSDDNVHRAGETEIKEIDECLLSEPDAVGGFQVDRDLELDQEGGSDVQSQLKSQVNSLDVSSAALRRASEVRPMDGTVTLLGTHSEDPSTISKEVKLVVDQPASPTIEVVSSVDPPHEDPELTVHNPKLHALEACSLEELDSVFKQHHEKAAEPSSSSSTFASSGTSNSEVGASESVISDREVKESYPHFQVLEEKSMEDTSLALKQLGEGDLHKPSSSKFEPSDGKALPEGGNVAPIETKTGVELLEAEPLEGIGFQTTL